MPAMDGCRNGIRFLKICGEILSSDTTAITPFIHTLRAKMVEMELKNEQLYNADESGLFFRLIPDKTFVAACEKTAPGRKIQKQRITFMLCGYVKPLVIGKAKKPRCFRDFQNPLYYDHSANAWMTAKIFKNWFHNTFVKEVRVCCISVSQKGSAIQNQFFAYRYDVSVERIRFYQKHFCCWMTVAHIHRMNLFALMTEILWQCSSRQM